MQDLIVLVDTKDKETGLMGKLEAHQRGLLHRAFSILIFNSSNEFLLQRRANNKYHSAGLWSNTCCSHPMPEESILDASHRRLKQEMGLSSDSLKEIYSIIYKIAFENELIEHELDHILIGFTDDAPILNKEEASAWKYMSYTDLKKDITEHPDTYTFWFRMIFEKAYRLAMKGR